MKDLSLILQPSGRIEVHSADPTKARLVFRWMGGAGERKTYDKISVVFSGKTQFNGVLFENINKGGILLADGNATRTWKNVFFGSNNDGKPDELYTVMGGGSVLPAVVDDDTEANAKE